MSKVKTINLYGAGGHSTVIKEMIELHGDQIGTVYDDNPENAHPVFTSFRIDKGVAENLDGINKSIEPLIIAVGNNSHRYHIAEQLSVSFTTVIHETAIIAKNTTIEEGTAVLAGAIIQTNTRIGNHVLINTGASVDHDNDIADFVHIAPKAALCGHVSVGIGTEIGVGASVIPGIRIGKWCTIGAGTVILQDVPDYAVVVGNPGKVIKYNKPHE